MQQDKPEITPSAIRARGFAGAVGRWLDINIFSLGREMRLSYLPPLMVYAAAGISGLTSIVGTFYVKEQLGLTAEFLAALAFFPAEALCRQPGHVAPTQPGSEQNATN